MVAGVSVPLVLVMFSVPSLQWILFIFFGKQKNVICFKQKTKTHTDNNNKPHNITFQQNMKIKMMDC
jgi:ABC-type arginine transport system permease subunit